jgi:hypothetical protein
MPEINDLRVTIVPLKTKCPDLPDKMSNQS